MLTSFLYSFVYTLFCYSGVFSAYGANNVNIALKTAFLPNAPLLLM